MLRVCLELDDGIMMVVMTSVGLVMMVVCTATLFAPQPGTRQHPNSHADNKDRANPLENLRNDHLVRVVVREEVMR